MRRLQLQLRWPVPAWCSHCIAAAAALASLAGPLTVAPATLNGATGTHTGSPPGWTTVFSDHFTGPAGSGPGSQWTYDTGTHYNGTSCPAAWGTGEVKTDTKPATNVHQDGHGHLLISPVKTGAGWTSGRIGTVSSAFAAPAGGELKVTASIKQPVPSGGLGYWPAFWMLGGGFRATPAIRHESKSVARPSAVAFRPLVRVRARTD